MPLPYTNTGKPILDSWAIHENLAFNWKIHWKNASTDVLFELPPLHDATLPTLTPRHCKRLRAISAITKSSLLAFTIMENDPRRDPTLHFHKKKKHGGGTRYKSRNSSTKVLNKGLSAGFLSSDNGTRAQGGEDAAASSLQKQRIRGKMTEKKQLIL